MKGRFAIGPGGVGPIAMLLAGAIAAAAGAAGAAQRSPDADGIRGLVDNEMEDRIDNRLMMDVNVDHQDLTVDVNEGVATVRGPVNSHFEEKQVLKDANKVAGINKIRDRLHVMDDRKPEEPIHDATRPGYQPYVQFTSDRELEQAVSEELWWSPLVDRDEINVDADHGRVWLAGMVDSSTEREAALQNAWEGGARRVQNDLQLKREG